MKREQRDQQFIESLRDWGQVFMLIAWLQSIMINTIARKRAGADERRHVTERTELMEHDLANVWRTFKKDLPAEISEEEELAASMIILLRNQLAHCFIKSSGELALFLPKKGH